MNADQQFVEKLKSVAFQCWGAIKLIESGKMQQMSEQERAENIAKYGEDAFAVGDWIVRPRK